MKRVLFVIALFAAVTLAANPAEAGGGQQTCSQSYCKFNCGRYCIDPEIGAVSTCESWLRVTNTPGDNDGVPSSYDNCVCGNNANQADCDGDGRGDVCDSKNELWIPTGQSRPDCDWSGSTHFGYFKVRQLKCTVYRNICGSGGECNDSSVVRTRKCYFDPTSSCGQSEGKCCDCKLGQYFPGGRCATHSWGLLPNCPF